MLYGVARKWVRRFFARPEAGPAVLCWYLVVPGRCRYARSSSSLEKCVRRSENILEEASRKRRGIIALLTEVKKQGRMNREHDKAGQKSRTTQ